MIFKIFAFWRIGLFLVTFLGSLALPKIDNGGFGSIGPSRQYNYWLSLAQWDGGHYFQIAKDGYIFISDYAFFPLYPALINLAKILFLDNLMITGLVASNVAFLLFLLIFFEMVKKKYSREVAISTIATFVTFPTTFFAVSYYSESLFLLLTVITFYFLSSKKFLLAALATSLANLTRLVGAALIVAVFYSYFSSFQMSLKAINRKIILAIPALFGLVIYSLYLFSKLNDPFKYLTSQTFWQRSISDPISTITSYIWATLVGEARPFNDYFDLFLTLSFLIILIAGVKKISSSLWIFSMLVILIPASTGTLTSMPRYLLSSLGVFIIVGSYLTLWPRLKIALWAISLAVQAILATRFITGYWVA
ncbi:hypothetical protein HYU92_04320 [Candidatus Curtissbacteria bacterium]|nr:hypothetical protein [Candidatus Curtissbacteria bacterium]